ncbi:MAG: DUF1571 domain-containing protein [Planctomycetes bacterium]|nr:DUF1571 domain-containing protein [Planctomycetota bacterium]
MTNNLLVAGIKESPPQKPATPSRGVLGYILLILLLISPLSLFPLLRGTKGTIDEIPPQPPSPLTPDQHLVLGCFGIFPGQSFPGAIPWEPFRKIGQQESRILEELAENDPVEFLQRCLDRVDQEVHSYRCIFEKRERVNGKLRQKETIRLHFRTSPFSVHMDWVKGYDLFGARRTIYVDKQNDGLLIVRALDHSIGPIREFAITDPQVNATSRFPITKSGMHKGALATIDSMRKAQAAGTLFVSYEGIVPVKELGNRLCYKLIRAPQVPPEEDGVNELIVYIDLVTHLQVGSILLDAKGRLIAEYYFRDVDINPEMKKDQFTRNAL